MRGLRTVRGVAAAVACVLALVVGAGCDWSQVGFDSAHTGFNPSEPALTATSTQHLGLSWFCAGCFQIFPSDPLVADGTVFTMTPGAPHLEDVTALDAATGATKWTLHWLPSLQVGAVANGIVYVAWNNGSVDPGSPLMALDETTGATRWQVMLPAASGTVGGIDVAAASGGVAYVFTNSAADSNSPFTGELSAVDTTGHVVWTVAPGGEIEDAAVVGGAVTVLWSEHLAVAPFVRTHLTTYATSDGHVLHSVALDLADGAGHPLTPERRLTVANGIAYFTAFWADPATPPHSVRGLIAADTVTGSIPWEVVPDDVSSFAVASGRLLSVARYGGTSALVARDPATGAVQWSADVPATSSTPGDLQPTAMTAAGDLVYVAGAGLDTYALADGTHAGRFAPPSAYASSVVASEGRVYVRFPKALVALKPS